MLSQSQIDSFHANGFLRMPGLIRPPELAALQHEAARVVAAGIAEDGDRHLYHEREDGTQVYWRSEELWRRHPVFRAVTVHPELLENIGQCIGQPFFPWNDSLVVKTPGGEGVSWHQDPPFGEPERTAPTPTPNFTTDIYLDESDEDNGCVWAIPGHHLVGHVRLDDRSQEDLFTRCGAVPVRMQPGDVLFHALSTPHGSRPNTSARMRRTFYIHYLAMEAHRDSGYNAAWKPIWSETRRAEVLAMGRDRESLGLGQAFGSHVRQVADGLEVHGLPMTPRHHWRALSQAIPEAQRRTRAALEGQLTSARG